MDDRTFATNRARRASLACISLGIPTQLPRLPGKPTDVATRRRQSMSPTIAAAVSHDLDCPAFLKQSFSRPVSRNNSSHASPVRGVTRTVSGDSKRLQPRGGSSHEQGATSSRLLYHRSRTTSLSNHARNEASEPVAAASSPLLTQGHLVSRSSRSDRMSRSSSLSSISSAQKDLLVVASASSCHTTATTLTASPSKGRRTSIRRTSSRASHAVSPTRTRRQGLSRRVSGDGASLVGPVAAAAAASSSPCVYEFDNDDVEEFAGDNDEPDEGGDAWPSPFESDDTAAADANAQQVAAPKQRRQDRQRLRHSAAAAASTVLNTRRAGRAPPVATPSPPQPVPRCCSLQPPSQSARAAAAPNQNHFEPHVRNATSTLPFHMPSLGIPLTEPKKEILFTPSSHKRNVSLTNSAHAAIITASDVALTPSLHKKPSSSREGTRRAPVSAMAALGSKSMVRSKSMDRFGMPSFNAEEFGVCGSPASKGGPQTPLTAASSDCSKQTKTLSSKTLSSRSTRSTLSTSSRDSSNKDETLKRNATPRSAPSSRSPLERSKSMDQYKSSDFLMLSPLSALPGKQKTHNAAPARSTPPLTSSASMAVPLLKQDDNTKSKGSSREIQGSGRKQHNDPSAATTHVPPSNKTASLNEPQPAMSTRNGRSRRASIGEDGKLHRQTRRTKESIETPQSSQQTMTTAATGRLRRRQSLSHAPSTDARTGTSSASRSNRRLSMCSSTDVDGGVTAVVTTMSRIQNQSIANSPDAIPMMNW